MTCIGIAILLVGSGAAAAQAINRTAPPSPSEWHEQSNELGTGQALFQDLIDGNSREFVAHFYLNTHYNGQYGPDKGVTYFMFALDTQRTPLVGSLDALVHGVTGEPLVVYREETEQGGKLVKWIVDAANMPEPGTPIVLRATIGATDEGQFQAGALLQPFNYRWEQVSTSSGTPASLYIFTQYGVNRATQDGCSGALCSVTNNVPAGALAGAVAAIGVAAVAAARRR